MKMTNQNANANWRSNYRHYNTQNYGIPMSQYYQSSKSDYMIDNSTTKQPRIKEVWASNFEKEMEIIRNMDTEFPGVIAKPIGQFRSFSDFNYQSLRANVDLLKLIQLGITFSDKDGKLPEDVSTWQFNFKFNLDTDMFAQDSIDLLQKSGIDFKQHQAYGIELDVFGELLISSGLVLSDSVRWISFHSGYDFGYLLKVVSGNILPSTEVEFFRLLEIYFPKIYDIKYLMKSCKNLKGGLQDIADRFKIVRIGIKHQAGSDSLVTSRTFFKLRDVYFENSIDDYKYMGLLYGLGQGASGFVSNYNLTSTNGQTAVMAPSTATLSS